MINPIGERVLVKEIVVEETKSTFVVAEGARQDKALRGEVVCDSDDLKAGDVVLFEAYGYAEVEEDGEIYLVVPKELLLCKIS